MTVKVHFLGVTYIITCNAQINGNGLETVQNECQIILIPQAFLSYLENFSRYTTRKAWVIKMMSPTLSGENF